MAYSNWGAFVWKNGILKPEFSDNALICENDEWKVLDEREILDEKIDFENKNKVGAHATIPFGSFCLEFLKCYPPIIHFNSSTFEIEEEDFYSQYFNENLDLEIISYPLGNNRSNDIKVYNIRHKDDYYCVIIGLSIGNGYEKTPISKFILKNITFDKSAGDSGKYAYIINHSHNIYDMVDLDMIIDKYNRKYDIQYNKRRIIDYLKEIFKFENLLHFKKIKFYIRMIIEHIRMIYWLH
jgi:hypothetical protein